MQLSELQDQATGLRRLLGEHEQLRTLAIFGPDARLNAAAASSLAFALARRGSRVCVIDEAPAPHNLTTHLGLTPRFTLADVARRGISFADALSTGPGEIRVLTAPHGFDWASGIAEADWARMGEAFSRMGSEWLLLTAPVPDTPSLALAAEQRVLVLPALKTRLTEAYAVLKAAHQRQPDGQWQTLVMNAASEERALQMAIALQETSAHFLDIEPMPFGAIPSDEKLDQAVRAMRPLLEMSPNAPAAMAFRNLAESMQSWQWDRTDRETFWRRMGLLSRLAMAHTTSMFTPQHDLRHGRLYG